MFANNLCRLNAGTAFARAGAPPEHWLAGGGDLIEAADSSSKRSVP